jgi:flagellar motor switch protein FliG
MIAETTLQESGVRKAAILVASLDRTLADAMLEQLPPEQSQQVRRAAASLGRIDPAEQQRIIDEFLRIGPLVPDASPSGIELDSPQVHEQLAAGKGASGPDDFQDRTAASARSVGADRPLPRMSEAPRDRRPDGVDATDSLFGFLRETDDEKLAHLLQGERPQAIALILSRLPSSRAAGVLAHVPPNLQVEIIRRLIDLDETDPNVMQEVQRALEARLSRQFATQRRHTAGLETVSEILEAFDGRMGGRLLENLAASDRKLAERLGLKTVHFDDIASLDDAAVAATQQAADPELLFTALVGAPPPVVERFLTAMAPRDAKRLTKQLRRPGPLRLSDIEDAQRQIAALVQRLLKNSATPNSAFAA